MKNENGISRRDFMKLAGLTAVSLPIAKVVGKIGNDEIIASPEQYGEFLIRRQAASNLPPFQVDNSVYKRFDEQMTVFARQMWDPIVQGGEAPFAQVPQQHIENNDPGFTRLDYAFYTAAWTAYITGHLRSWQPLNSGFVGMYNLYALPPWQPKDWTPEEVTAIVKKAAKFYGASLSGVAMLDERWVYNTYFAYEEVIMYGAVPPATGQIVFSPDVTEPQVKDDGTKVVPTSMKYVVSMAFEMDADGIETVISGPGSAAIGNGYSRMAFVAGTLAEFFRALGYHAIPMGNDTALSIPIAIDAGLGELGRNGLLITPKYGPRVRLAKVLTDMPLVPDIPISFGVTEFCEICGKCADNCPTSAILKGRNARTDKAINESNNPGTYKWPVDGVKCHLNWAQSGMDCSICIRTCPFNKPQSWLHDATRILIGAKTGSLDQLLVKLDDASGYGPKQDPNAYWKKDNFIHIKNT